MKVDWQQEIERLQNVVQHWQTRFNKKEADLAEAERLLTSSSDLLECFIDDSAEIENGAEEMVKEIDAFLSRSKEQPS